ncbi:MAG: class I SAM-dependent methyltransferase [Acidobacteriota bacterium]
MNVREQFGDIDIYLFDQILKDKFHPKSKILDAGCGGGRNIIWFLRNNFEVFGIDQNENAVEYCRQLAQELTPNISSENFQIAPVEKIPFADNSFDLVICSAVLHFAEDENHFDKMFNEMWRVLKPNGVLFARLASDIGIEHLVHLIEGRRFLLPDGSERFLVNEKMLIDKTEKVGGTFIEPIKTTNVQNLRCMTTWVLRK